MIYIPFRGFLQLVQRSDFHISNSRCSNHSLISQTGLQRAAPRTHRIYTGQHDCREQQQLWGDGRSANTGCGPSREQRSTDTAILSWIASGWGGGGIAQPYSAGALLAGLAWFELEIYTWSFQIGVLAASSLVGGLNGFANILYVFPVQRLLPHLFW